jgi:hypothetical protein
MTSHFSRPWPLAPTVIDYIACHIGGDRKQACAALREEFANGTIETRGPVVDATASPIASEFWRFGVLDPDGSAIDLSKLKKLAWVEINAADVIAVWPPKIPAQARGGRPGAEDWREWEKVLRREIDTVGFPDRNQESEWQTQADVCRWLQARLPGDGPHRNTLKRNVKMMLERYRKEKDQN